MSDSVNDSNIQGHLKINVTELVISLIGPWNIENRFYLTDVIRAVLSGRISKSSEPYSEEKNPTN